MILPEELNKNKRLIEKSNRNYIKRLKKLTPKGISEKVKEFDAEVFTSYDCTTCANCCKTISPILKNRDITRLAAFFKMKPGGFTEKYLKTDSDGDFVMQQTPCPFLDPNNLCSVYEQRPEACRKYPHTSSLDVRKSWDLLVKNSAVCPGVNEIITKLKSYYK